MSELSNLPDKLGPCRSRLSKTSFIPSAILTGLLLYVLEEESRTLAALRDALLPKLVSGELRVT